MTGIQMTLEKVEHDCSIHGVIGSGPKPCDVMLIGIAAGKTEWKAFEEKGKQTPFIGPAGKLLDGTLAACHWSRDKVFTTNLYCGWNDDPLPEEIEQCKPRLIQEIEECDPVFVVLLGQIVSDEFLGYKKWKRGRLYFRNGRWWMPTYHPAAFLHQPSKLDVADFARDIGKIEFVSQWRGRTPPKPTPIVIESVEEANDLLWSLEGLTAIDIESSYDGKSFAYPDDDLVGDADSKLLCFSVSNANGTWVIPGHLVGKLRAGWGARTEVIWIMQNGFFDIGKLRRLTGERLLLGEDTLLQSYSLDERGAGTEEEDTRATGPHGLKKLTTEFLGMEDYDVNVLKADYDELHYYNGCDTFGTFLLNPFFKERQIRDDVRSMYENILIPGARALAEIQERGVNIDLKMLYTLGVKWSSQWLELHERLQAEARELGWDKEEFNLNSHPQLRRFIFDIIGAKPHKLFGRSTNKNVLEDFAERYPWCATFQEWKGINHVLNSYIRGIEDDIKFDGRLHPEPILHAQVAGRLSYHKPPVQTIPKWGVDPELAVIRHMFCATTDEYVIIEADLKQGEMWATAYLAHDEVMLDALKTGDAHAVTAKEIFNVDETHPNWKPYREIGKLFNFGTLYNRQAKSYVDNPWQGRKPPKGLENFKFTKHSAQGFINSWFKKYPKVKAYQQEQTRIAFRYGEQQSVTGRKRRYWLPSFKTRNQAVNTGPQTLSHDYLFNSLIKLHTLLKPYDAHIMFEVHDSLIIEANKKYLKQTLELVEQIMTEPKFGFGGIPCDINYGRSWGEVKAIKWDEVEEWSKAA